MLVAIPVALLLGLLGGWLAHRRLSLHYKQLWQQAVGQLEDKSLWGDGDPTPVLPPPQPGNSGHIVAHPLDPGIPYVHGKWAFYEKREGTTAIYQAVRVGFDPVDLGQTSNFQRFGALYRRDREQAQDGVNEMNAKRAK
jgi:hypothetical protein